MNSEFLNICQRGSCCCCCIDPMSSTLLYCAWRVFFIKMSKVGQRIIIFQAWMISALIKNWLRKPSWKRIFQVNRLPKSSNLVDLISVSLSIHLGLRSYNTWLGLTSHSWHVLAMKARNMELTKPWSKTEKEKLRIGIKMYWVELSQSVSEVKSFLTTASSMKLSNLRYNKVS